MLIITLVWFSISQIHCPSITSITPINQNINIDININIYIYIYI